MPETLSSSKRFESYWRHYRRAGCSSHFSTAEVDVQRNGPLRNDCRGIHHDALIRISVELQRGNAHVLQRGM